MFKEIYDWFSKIEPSVYKADLYPFMDSRKIYEETQEFRDFNNKIKNIHLVENIKKIMKEENDYETLRSKITDAINKYESMR
jgi:hypothetical protein